MGLVTNSICVNLDSAVLHRRRHDDRTAIRPNFRPLLTILDSRTRDRAPAFAAPSAVETQLEKLLSGWPADYGSKIRSFRDALASADLVAAAYRRPALVYAAQHGVSFQGGAPTIGESRHDLSVPWVRLRQFGRHIVLRHQHHLQPAAAGLARAACYRCVVFGGIQPCVQLDSHVLAGPLGPRAGLLKKRLPGLCSDAASCRRPCSGRRPGSSRRRGAGARPASACVEGARFPGASWISSLTISSHISSVRSRSGMARSSRNRRRGSWVWASRGCASFRCTSTSCASIGFGV